MDRIALLIDDAGQARRALASLLAPDGGSTHCLLVACPPRLNHRIGRWLCAADRRLWQQDWCDRLQHDLRAVGVPVPPATTFEWLTARPAADDLTRQLRQSHGADLRVLDARRPRVGAPAMPLLAGQPPAGGRLAVPVAVTATLSMILALAD